MSADVEIVQLNEIEMTNITDQKYKKTDQKYQNFKIFGLFELRFVLVEKKQKKLTLLLNFFENYFFIFAVCRIQ